MHANVCRRLEEGRSNLKISNKALISRSFFLATRYRFDGNQRTTAGQEIRKKLRYEDYITST